MKDKMNHRQRFQSLIAHRSADHRGFWKGNPTQEALERYYAHFKVDSPLALSREMGDDFHWLPADILCWRYPHGENIFNEVGKIVKNSQAIGEIFADCESVAEVEKYKDFPNPDYFDFDLYEKHLNEAQSAGMAIAGGAWSCFFHVVSDYFGMENYFCKMHSDPEVVDALTERVVDLFVQINENVLSRFSDKIDCVFMGNDFGTQLDLMISPEHFRRFILPYYKKLIAVAGKYNKPVMLHSCGSIAKIIPDLIGAGVSALHPLQALAKGMDAQSLSQYRNDLLFVGGVDTQHLLPFGSPKQIQEEIFRIADLWGEGWIVSPSHEALLVNVAPENLQAMRDAAEKLQ